MGGRCYQHVNVVSRYRSSNNHHFSRVTNLPNHIACTLRHLTAQNLITIYLVIHTKWYLISTPRARYLGIGPFP